MQRQGRQAETYINLHVGAIESFGQDRQEPEDGLDEGTGDVVTLVVSQLGLQKSRHAQVRPNVVHTQVRLY